MVLWKGIQWYEYFSTPWMKVLFYFISNMEWNKTRDGTTWDVPERNPIPFWYRNWWVRNKATLDLTYSHDHGFLHSYRFCFRILDWQYQDAWTCIIQFIMRLSINLVMSIVNSLLLSNLQSQLEDADYRDLTNVIMLPDFWCDGVLSAYNRTQRWYHCCEECNPEYQEHSNTWYNESLNRPHIVKLAF